MHKNLSAKYYLENKERLHKKLLKKKKKKSNIMVMNVIKFLRR